MGALGEIRLERGWYAYVGSARRARAARVARHLSPAKSLRWHADYLFVAHPPVCAWLVDVPQTAGRGPVPGPSSECLLVDALREASGRRPQAVAAAADGHPRTTCRPSGGHARRSGAALRFGASDCRCAGHLLWFRDRRSLDRALVAAAGVLGASLRSNR